MHPLTLVRRAQLLACAFVVGLSLLPALALADSLVVRLGENAQVREQVIGTQSYLMLPSCADLRALELACVDDDGAPVAASVTLNGATAQLTGEPVDLLAGGVQPSIHGGELGDVYALSLSTDEGTRYVHVKRSEHIGAVFISSERGRAFVDESPDHSAKDTGHLTVLDARGTSLYDDALAQVKGRGNSTWTSSAKKPYQLKLSSKADLLGGAQPAKTWILLANAADPTLLRNTLALKLAGELGIPYAASCEPVDLYYDREYRGSYLLTEKNEVGTYRVAIADLEGANDDANEGNPAWDDATIAEGTNAHGYPYEYVVGAREPADASGGYLVEYDMHSEGDDITFGTLIAPFTLKAPDPPTQGEARMISDLVDEAFRQLIIGEQAGGTPEAYFDLDALARMGCLEEFVKDGDYLSVSSSFFAVDQGDSRLVACAPWDFDRAFPASPFGPNGFARVALVGNPSLQGRFAALWHDELAPLVKEVLLGDEQAAGARGVLRSLSYYQAQIDASRRMDETLWGLAPMQDEWLERDGTAISFGDACATLRAFAQRRAAFLDAWTQGPLATGTWLPEGSFWRGNTLAFVLNGQLQRGSFTDEQGRARYTDPQLGIVSVGWTPLEDGTWFYADEQGMLHTGWIDSRGLWYYLDPSSGRLRSGWLHDGRAWYYLDPESCTLRTGWVHDGGSWYYLDPASGALHYGWLQDGDAWYYLDPASGALRTGWLEVAGSWYLLAANGALQHGWQSVDGRWYLCDRESGALRTGWALDGGTWYYLDPASGSMATGWVWDNGWYYLDESGAWIA